jgi:hypothetical protein
LKKSVASQLSLCTGVGVAVVLCVGVEVLIVDTGALGVPVVPVGVVLLCVSDEPALCAFASVYGPVVAFWKTCPVCALVVVHPVELVHPVEAHPNTGVHDDGRLGVAFGVELAFWFVAIWSALLGVIRGAIGCDNYVVFIYILIIFIFIIPHYEKENIIFLCWYSRGASSFFILAWYW